MPDGGVNAAQWAWMAIQQGWSAAKGLREFRNAGGHLADSTWRRLFSEIQHSAATITEKLGQSVNRVPVASEIQIWETVTARGYVQQVEVLIRDRATNEIISIPFSLTGKTLRSRNTALKAALDTYSPDSQSGEGQQILGAVYTGTYEMRPREA